VADRAADPAPELEADLGQLRRLARARLAGHDRHLVVADDREQVLAALAHRQLRRVAHRRYRGSPSADPGLGSLQLGGEPRERSGRGVAV